MFEEDVAVEMVLLNKSLSTLLAFVGSGTSFGMRWSVFVVREQQCLVVSMLHVPFQLSYTFVAVLTQLAF